MQLDTRFVGVPRGSASSGDPITAGLGGLILRRRGAGRVLPGREEEVSPPDRSEDPEAGHSRQQPWRCAGAQLDTARASSLLPRRRTCCFLFKHSYLFETRIGGRHTQPTCCFTLQVATAAMAGPGRSQAPGALSMSQQVQQPLSAAQGGQQTCSFPPHPRRHISSHYSTLLKAS